VELGKSPSGKTILKGENVQHPIDRPKSPFVEGQEGNEGRNNVKDYEGREAHKGGKGGQSVDEPMDVDKPPKKYPGSISENGKNPIEHPNRPQQIDSKLKSKPEPIPNHSFEARDEIIDLFKVILPLHH
jgi:hypothetical protein